jgi:hypothetical protein
MYFIMFYTTVIFINYLVLFPHFIYIFFSIMSHKGFPNFLHGSNGKMVSFSMEKS